VAEAPTPRPPAAPCGDAAGPVVEYPNPLTGRNTVNLSPHFVGRLGGAFSFMCTLTMEGIDSWTRVFDFSLQADEDSITAGAIDLTLNLHFTVFRGKKPISLRVDNFFELGKEFTMLCTVSDSGHMKVFKDGVLAGEKVDGLAPLTMDRPRMYLGGHFQFSNQTFRGSIKDAKVWNREVSWPALAAVPGKTAEDPCMGLDGALDAAAAELIVAQKPAPGAEAAEAAEAGEGDGGASVRLDQDEHPAVVAQPEVLTAGPGAAAGECDEGAPRARA